MKFLINLEFFFSSQIMGVCNRFENNTFLYTFFNSFVVTLAPQYFKFYLLLRKRSIISGKVADDDYSLVSPLVSLPTAEA